MLLVIVTSKLFLYKTQQCLTSESNGYCKMRAHCTSPIMSFELYPDFLLDAELHLSVTFRKFITYILS